MTIGRATYQPGWKWSEHVGAALGAATPARSSMSEWSSRGCATAAMDDGEVIEMRAGDMFYIPAPGHDSWVVGDEPYVSLHFMGAERLCRRARLSRNGALSDHANSPDHRREPRHRPRVRAPIFGGRLGRRSRPRGSRSPELDALGVRGRSRSTCAMRDAVAAFGQRRGRARPVHRQCRHQPSEGRRKAPTMRATGRR